MIVVLGSIVSWHPEIVVHEGVQDIGMLDLKTKVVMQATCSCVKAVGVHVDVEKVVEKEEAFEALEA